MTKGYFSSASFRNVIIIALIPVLMIRYAASFQMMLSCDPTKEFNYV